MKCILEGFVQNLHPTQAPRPLIQLIPVLASYIERQTAKGIKLLTRTCFIKSRVAPVKTGERTNTEIRRLIRPRIRRFHLPCLIIELCSNASIFLECLIVGDL